MTSTATLPYAGTSGWAGSEASKSRALAEDLTGITSERQTKTIELLAEADVEGLTWRELSEKLGVHHGKASGVLSALHKAGRISRLKYERRGCSVYVLNRCVKGGTTVPHRGTRAARDRATIERIERFIEGEDVRLIHVDGLRSLLNPA